MPFPYQNIQNRAVLCVYLKSGFNIIFGMERTTVLSTKKKKKTFGKKSFFDKNHKFLEILKILFFAQSISFSDI